MNRGVYIVANDRVVDNAIALLSSLRLHDPHLPVFLIPFNDTYQQALGLLSQHFQVQLFPDLDLLNALTQQIAEIFPRQFLKLPNKLRKLATWFGPLEEFLYIDTDILLFRPPTATLDYLADADFIACDFQYRRGLADVFTEGVLTQGVFTESEVQDVFNSGFWGSRRSALPWEQMIDRLRDCAQHPEYFDFSSGTTDQPILNYLVLSSMPRRLNLTRTVFNEPGSWAGSPHFVEIQHQLYDGDCPLRYLHWAGTPMAPGGPYRQLWEYYRFRTVSLPLQSPPPPLAKPSLRQRISQYFKA